jgi:hypothetical protein
LAHKLSGQSKKVGCGCPHCFREIDSVFERVTKNSVYGISTLHSNETPVLEYEGSINGNTKKRRPPPHLTGHKFYEMVKDAHVVLGKWKKTNKNTEDGDM